MAGLADNPMRVVTAGAALAGAVLSVAAAHLDIVGTIAGDDTIMVITTGEAASREVAATLMSHARRDPA